MRIGDGLVAISLVGCQVVGGFEEFEAKGNLDAGSTCQPTGVAPGTAGADMAYVSQQNAGCFWIDRSEVTLAQYQSFLAAKVDVAGQASLCTWNETFERPSSCTGTDTISADRPATCVDWCDALAFCTWAGKTLCVGSATNTAANPGESRWYAACSDNGAQDYPYGATFDGARCNGDGRPDTGCSQSSGSACSTLPSGSLTTCATGAGVRDLLGNVAEWVDECDATNGQGDNCKARGGGVNDPPDSTRCSVAVSRKRDFANRFLGFRCCSE